MSFSTTERISHVYRRMGMGSYPELLETTATVDDALERAMRLDQEAPDLLEMEPPLDRESATDVATLAAPVQSWLSSMATSPRLIEERLTWFFTDHFATAIQKVRIPYLLWQQHLTIRKHATGSFADLLHAVAFDPAMLFYLDGGRNQRDNINENFAREVMELHTMGTGNYSQTDVTEASRALTGWVVNVPYGRMAQRFLSDHGPWEAVYLPFRHDDAPLKILGLDRPFTPNEFIDLLLEQPATAEFLARKMWVELVGTEPEEEVIRDLAAIFRSDYSTMALVEAIVANPAFVSDQAIRSKVRTPVERLIAVTQALGSDEVDERLGYSLHGMSYLPFNPPSPAGYPRGQVLLGPHQLVHSFDLLAVATPDESWNDADFLARLGVFDTAENTKEVLAMATDPQSRAALAANSPEFALI